MNIDEKEYLIPFIEKIRKEEIRNKFKENKNKEKYDEQICKDAIWLGYLDACRTFTKEKTISEDDSRIDLLAKEIKNYLNGNRECEFTHQKYCEILMGKDNHQMTFGQAQKIVNMAFKYLYCIADQNNKALCEKFDVCHMPIDGIMLEWIYRTSLSDSDGNSIKKKCIGSWSKIELGKKDDKGDDFDSSKPYTYSFYQKWLNEYCKNKKCRQLELDFFYWDKMAKILSAEEYLKSFNNKETACKFLNSLDFDEKGKVKNRSWLK